MHIKAAVRAAILALPLAALPVAGMAGPASERVFSRTAMDLMQTGDVTVYSHIREGTAKKGLKALPDGEIRVTLQLGSDGNREAAVTMGERGKLRPTSIWPASSGNPILPIFLESALRAMSGMTGGSTFYIRNRIKDSLGRGGTIEDIELDVGGGKQPVKHIVFAPFAEDKNRARMGPFADLKLHFYVSDQVAGDIVRFVATTGAEDGEAVYREIIRFDSAIKGD